MSSTTRTYRIVGPGRAGGSFDIALTSCGWSAHGRYGRADDIAAVADGVDVVVLAVPDGAISDVAARITPGAAAVIHLSGATTLAALEPHPRRGSVHPLISLPDAETGAARLLDRATFAISGDRIGARIVAAFDGRAIEVAEERRAVYHAAAVVASNHLVALCAQVERLAAEVGVPVDAYWDLMRATLDNVATSGAGAALTGPATRGDIDTIRAHLSALPTAERELYLSLADEAARIAGTTSPSTAGP